MKRRNRKELEQAAQTATGKRKAIAYYNLGLFHDNNAREIEAIPNYLQALKLGLEAPTKAQTLAWLASSLYKTNQAHKGLKKCQEAQKITKNENLKKFLAGLERRITRSLKYGK